VRNIKKKNPERIILDSNATIRSSSRILKTCPKIPTIIAVSKKAQKKNLQRLEKFPVQVIVCGNYTVNIKKLLGILKKKGIKNILVEGGGTTNWAFVKENLVDEAIITITPYLVSRSFFEMCFSIQSELIILSSINLDLSKKWRNIFFPYEFHRLVVFTENPCFFGDTKYFKLYFSRMLTSTILPKLDLGLYF